jgi:hypothetical protein
MNDSESSRKVDIDFRLVRRRAGMLDATCGIVIGGADRKEHS